MRKGIETRRSRARLRKVSLNLRKKAYLPGDRIEGFVTVSTDEYFECNRVVLSIKGLEQSRVTEGSGDTRRVYSEKKHHIDKRVELVGSTGIQAGETRFPFRFVLPANIPGSFQGINGEIDYKLEAKAEISWAIDPKAEQKIAIGMKQETPNEQSVHANLDDDGVRLLSVQLSSDLVRLGRDYPIKLMVSSEAKIRGVRIELVYHEFVSPEGHESTRKKTLVKLFLEDLELPREMWIDATIGTQDGWLQPFKSELIETYYKLKATLDIAWRLDKTIWIPLKITHEPSQNVDKDQFEFGFY
jgi:hypothetical protein